MDLDLRGKNQARWKFWTDSSTASSAGTENRPGPHAFFALETFKAVKYFLHSKLLKNLEKQQIC
jgi:hypothetical protein